MKKGRVYRTYKRGYAKNSRVVYKNGRFYRIQDPAPSTRGRVYGQKGRVYGQKGRVYGQNGRVYGQDGRVYGQRGRVYGQNGQQYGSKGQALGVNKSALTRTGPGRANPQGHKRHQKGTNDQRNRHNALGRPGQHQIPQKPKPRTFVESFPQSAITVWGEFRASEDDRLPCSLLKTKAIMRADQFCRSQPNGRPRRHTWNCTAITRVAPRCLRAKQRFQNCMAKYREVDVQRVHRMSKERYCRTASSVRINCSGRTHHGREYKPSIQIIPVCQITK